MKSTCPRFFSSSTLVTIFITIGLSALLTACGGSGSESSSTTGVSTKAANEAEAVHFLNTSSFGANATDVQQLLQTSYSDYLDQQFAQASTGYQNYSFQPGSPAPSCSIVGNFDDPTPSNICYRRYYTPYYIQYDFFKNAVHGSDQLRQRVGFALSQIFVVGWDAVGYAYGLANYQNMLLNDSFGNFRTLMTDVTKHPYMGAYLSTAGNNKYHPNENYARELLQLFTIGTYELNLDGSYKLDGSGNRIPTYGNAEVVAFSKAFTGWTYVITSGDADFSQPMQAYEPNHDTTTKNLLNGYVQAAGGTTNQDLTTALDNIFNHPNVAPFIGKQLIQHLVTSNPSPAYIYRISKVFENNGQGVRGDLKAVIKAILTDTEALATGDSSNNKGRLMDPALFTARFLRSMGGQTDGYFGQAYTDAMGQSVYRSPSVFNYYPPDYELPNQPGVLSPASSIFTSNAIFYRSNMVDDILFRTNSGLSTTNGNEGRGYPKYGGEPSHTGTWLDISPWLAYSNDPEKLISKISAKLLTSPLSTYDLNVIYQTVLAIPASDTHYRVRTAIYLIALNPQAQILY